MQVPGYRLDRKVQSLELLQRKLEQWGIVRFKMNLPTWSQNPAVLLQKTAVSQAPLGILLPGPGVTEVYVHAVQFAGSKAVLNPCHIDIHKKHVSQIQLPGLLHGHHHGVRHPLHGNEEHVRIGGSRLHRKPPLPTAHLDPQGLARGRQIPPAARHPFRLPDPPVCTPFHPWAQIWLFSHSHGTFLPQAKIKQFIIAKTPPGVKRNFSFPKSNTQTSQ